VDATVELEENAERITAGFVGEDLELVIGHHGGYEAHTPSARRRRSPSAAGLARDGHGDSTAARRGITRERDDPDPLSNWRGPGVRDHCPFHEG
jgi:hypothetical protein